MEQQRNEKVIQVEISKEMKKSYIDYAMSVIAGRALPDVRDGLKPVHRRIIYTMNEDGFTPDKPHRKCATTVGDVLGRYHPHGDAAVYDALVRMAQDFSLRYPLIDGHGNFGSVDGDGAAAYRYTEARMSRLATVMLRDIEKDTVDFVPNFDENRKEPVVVPSRFPQLLCNGSSGIAVGMATNIPPHNLCEVVDGIVAVIDNPELTLDELMEHIKGPDFPTYGVIMGKSGIRKAYETGRGKIVIRARTEIEEMDNGKSRIIVTEIPYQVNKARMIEKMADLAKDKKVDGITDIRDESDRDGMRVVIELRRDVNANIVLNQLFKYTQLQEAFGIIMLALVDGQPKVLSLREMLDHYIDFQKSVIVRRTQFDLKKAQARAHILEGLRIALDNIDEVIATIRASYNDAKEKLMERFGLSDVQAQAILDMRLARLQGLEREKIEEEYAELMKQIAYYQAVLASEQMVLDIVKAELLEVKEKYGDDRRSEITMAVDEINLEDLIEEEDNVITMTHYGYIKRLPVDTYKSQHRGGRGISGLQTREEDFVETLFISSTHAHLLFFTNRGRMFKIKAYQIPESGRQSKGTAIVNLIELDNDEKITAMIPVREFEDGYYLTMVTKNGVVKKTPVMDYASTRRGGLIAIGLREDDELIRVKLTDGNQQLILGTRDGMCIKFAESDVRPMGRGASGVMGIRLHSGDQVVGMSICREGGSLLTVTENGYGKKTPLEEFKLQNRGGKGVTGYRLTDKTGLVAGMKVVDDNDDAMIITSDGVIIRTGVEEISEYGRVTQGVRVMRPDDGVSVVSIARVEKEAAEEQSEDHLQKE